MRVKTVRCDKKLCYSPAILSNALLIPLSVAYVCMHSKALFTFHIYLLLFICAIATLPACENARTYISLIVSLARFDNVIVKRAFEWNHRDKAMKIYHSEACQFHKLRGQCATFDTQTAEWRLMFSNGLYGSRH